MKSTTGEIKLWSLDNGKLLLTLMEHTGFVVHRV